MTSRPGERQSRFHVRLSVSTRLRPVGGAAKASLGPFVMCGEREKKKQSGGDMGSVGFTLESAPDPGLYLNNSCV